MQWIEKLDWWALSTLYLIVLNILLAICNQRLTLWTSRFACFLVLNLWLFDEERLQAMIGASILWLHLQMQLLIVTYLEMFRGIDHFCLWCSWCRAYAPEIHATGKQLVGNLLLLSGRLERSGHCSLLLFFFLTQVDMVGCWNGLRGWARELMFISQLLNLENVFTMPESIKLLVDRNLVNAFLGRITWYDPVNLNLFRDLWTLWKLLLRSVRCGASALHWLIVNTRLYLRKLGPLECFHRHDRQVTVIFRLRSVVLKYDAVPWI